MTKLYGRLTQPSNFSLSLSQVLHKHHRLNSGLLKYNSVLVRIATSGQLMMLLSLRDAADQRVEYFEYSWSPTARDLE